MAKQEVTDQVAAVATHQPIKFLSKQEVLAIIGVSSALLSEWIRDGHFPAARELGAKPGGNRTKIGWIDAEVYEWMRNTPQRSRENAVPIARVSRDRHDREDTKKKRRAG
jgi:predicted DNA-binding transcriptional regulator AlpA